MKICDCCNGIGAVRLPGMTPMICRRCRGLGMTRSWWERLFGTRRQVWGLWLCVNQLHDDRLADLNAFRPTNALPLVRGEDNRVHLDMRDFW